MFLLSLAASIATGVCSTLLIRAIHVAVGDEGQGASAFLLSFLPLLLGYLLASSMASYTISDLTRRTVHDLRVRLTGHIIRAEYAPLENLRGRLLPVLTDDISTMATVIERLPSVANGLATVTGILAYMVWLSPVLALITLGAFILIFISNKVGIRFMGRYAERSRMWTNEVFRAFEGLVNGLKSLKMDRAFRDSYIRRDVIPGSEEQTRHYMKHNVFNALVNRMNDVILFLFLGLVIVLIYKVGIVDMAFFNQYLTLILFLLAPLSTVSGFLGTLVRIEASIAQISDLGVGIGSATDEDGAGMLPDGAGSGIELAGVVYRHGSGMNGDAGFELGPIDAVIPEGRIIFVTGGNGSGKTTFIKVLCGLYTPAEGIIRYRGVEITPERRAAYRERFSVVFTDNHVFNHLSHIPADVLATRGPALLKLVGLEGKVAIRDGRYSDVDLSEGQKKRLVLVTALLEDKPVVVFDEWVAYQDAASRELFFGTVLPWLKSQGKTVLNIAHDAGFDHIADATLHLTYGRLDR